ncbi:hypothetical protein AAY473_017977 [Plecturocebus cupreus]
MGPETPAASHAAWEGPTECPGQLCGVPQTSGSVRAASSSPSRPAPRFENCPAPPKLRAGWGKALGPTHGKRGAFWDLESSPWGSRGDGSGHPPRRPKRRAGVGSRPGFAECKTQAEAPAVRQETALLEGGTAQEKAGMWMEGGRMKCPEGQRDGSGAGPRGASSDGQVGDQVSQWPRPVVLENFVGRGLQISLGLEGRKSDPAGLGG